MSGFVPSEMFRVNDRISIGIEALGGGTPGKAYANSRFVYRVFDGRKVILFGDDLKSGAFPKTPAEMAVILAEFLVSYAEDPEQMGTYMSFQKEWLENNADDLSEFVARGVPEGTGR